MYLTASKDKRASEAEQLDYWLRRAEQESIAAIRATGEASVRHGALARAYSALAIHLLD